MGWSKILVREPARPSSSRTRASSSHSCFAVENSGPLTDVDSRQSPTTVDLSLRRKGERRVPLYPLAVWFLFTVGRDLIFIPSGCEYRFSVHNETRCTAWMNWAIFLQPVDTAKFRNA